MGDVLLLQAPLDSIRGLQASNDLLVLDQLENDLPTVRSKPIAIAIAFTITITIAITIAIAITIRGDVGALLVRVSARTRSEFPDIFRFILFKPSLKVPRTKR